ncbi:peptidoglycan-binding protein LysM, partial [Chryseobacterium sp. CFBP8996]|nr:peptidoglycan-binding protein LysM [Chryseobacterium sp. CFBP8996]
MTKQIVIAALTLGAIALGTNNVKAQNTTAITTVNITLNDVISIDAGSAAIGNTVDFNYATAADYNSDQTITKANSLKVTSTKNFNVKVKA